MSEDSKHMSVFTSKYMDIAFKEAEQAETLDEVPVGAVIVHGITGDIIASAGNRVEQLQDPTAHAEMLAIKQACEILGQVRIPECDIYVTLEPCPMCAQAIVLSRLRRLYYSAGDEKGGGVEYGARIFDATSCHHKPDIYHGFQEERSKQLLQRFFKSKR